MWNTFGHDKPVGMLKRSLDEGRMSHAYLVVGPPQVGKTTVAFDLARAVNCLEDDRPCGGCAQCQRIDRSLHADVRVVGVAADESGAGRSRVVISIDQVRQVQREASLKPYEGRYRVFIFDRAEYLSEEASNCLLKTLEEPPEQVLLLLLAPEVGALLPTLVSRCQVLKLRPVPLSLVRSELEARHGVDPNDAEEIARLSGGRPGWAIEVAGRRELLEEISGKLGTIEGLVKGGPEERFGYAASLALAFGRDRETARQELATWLGWWRDILVLKEGDQEHVTHLSRLEALQAVAGVLSSAEVVRALQAVRETMDLLDRNVNARLAIEEMMLALPRA